MKGFFGVAYKFNEKTYASYFKPLIPISIKAQSITHVTDEMVDNKKTFLESKMNKDLIEIFIKNILVTQSAVFDLEMLVREGIEIDKAICIYKVARFFDGNYKIPTF